MPYSSLITFSVACKGMYLHTPILSHNSQTVQRNLMSQILTVCFIPTLSTFGFRWIKPTSMYTVSIPLAAVRINYLSLRASFLTPLHRMSFLADGFSHCLDLQLNK